MINFGFAISAEGLINLRLTDFRIRRKQMHNNFSIRYGFSCSIIGTLPGLQSRCVNKNNFSNQINDAAL